jgi:pimeloyl-ACP methyl ester carboxylesterase
LTTYVLLHGAGSDSWYWHRVVPLLEELGHEVLTPDLPVADGSVGFEQYADQVVQALGDRTGVVLVAQSLSGFVAPLVAARRPVDLLVLVAAMVPKPGESVDDWWGATKHAEAREACDRAEGRDPHGPFDARQTFLHDVPMAIVDQAAAHGVAQAEEPFEEPWPLDAWPDVPTRFLLCTKDRFFPADFQRRVVAARLAIVPDELVAGHLPALSKPDELVSRLEEYRLSAGPQQR